MEYEIAFALAFGALCAGIFWAHRRSARLEKERHERVMREIEENNDRIRKIRAERRINYNNWVYPSPSPVSATKVNETREHRRRYSDDRTMIYNDDSGDILTAMILQNALNSSSDTVSGSVRWDNDTPTITPSYTPSHTPSYESSSSSSYSSDSSSSYSSDSSSDSCSSSCD
jgi:hypothetical protein